MKRRRTLLALLCAGMALNQTAPAALQVTTAIYASESEQPFAEEENIVLNKPASASAAQSGRGAECAVDGSKGSYWCAATPAWIQIDLEGVYAIDAVNLLDWFDPAKGNANRYYEYQVLTSLTGEEGSFTVAADHTGTENREWTTASGERDELGGLKARYIRIQYNATHAENQPTNNKAHLQD